MPEEKLTLGIEMTLTKRLRADEGKATATAALAPQAKHVPAHMRVSKATVVQPRAFEYAFEDQSDEVSLVSDALGQLYLVLGAPGVGKSYFLNRLLQQLADKNRWNESWGGLLLDPKQTLLRDVKDTIPAEQRHVIGPKAGSRMNLLASHLEPSDLGTAVALAAQSAGISASDPYWINEMKRLFGDGLTLLQLTKKPLTLRNLAQLFLGSVTVDKKRTRSLDVAVERVQLLDLDEVDARRRDAVLSSIADFVESKGDNAQTVRSFIRQILSPFLDPDLDFVSDETSTDSIGDLIIREGKWVLLDVPKTKLSVSRFLSTLTKVLYASAALNRYQLYEGNDRRIFLFADEYAEIASDLPGEGFGDSYFFSQARQFRVLSVIATQGIPMLENSGVRETWKSILTNSAGKIMFRVADPDTAELAAKMLGESDVIMSGRSATHAREGASLSADQKIERWTMLSSDLFITGLQRGHLVYMGLTDGKGTASVRFVRVK